MTSTTGCSSGFGRASAALSLARGWNVIAAMRSPRPTLFEDSDRLLGGRWARGPRRGQVDSRGRNPSGVWPRR
jgi:NAD(P)-dependent dehydrogenase (short-subunit alcohol dehydrogenase family)